MEASTTAAAVIDAEEGNVPSTPLAVRRPSAPTGDVIVALKDAVKTYDGIHLVLKGINMTAYSGEIYGLLGPSGCGKTTLLNIIVGRSELNSGEILVKASRSEDIGYMPQNLDLHKNLTILQTYKFYGRMLNMDMNTILNRAKELEIMLELPSSQCSIEELSGGQQRRVSFAVALLHNPNILILDEPTVGLDPILSNSIWNNLLSFAKQGKTIIITTHYIEEANRAHTVGMMRNGVLVAEESPEMLMTRLHTVTLEEAFLAISVNQNSLSTFQVNASKMPPIKKSKTKLNLNDGVFRMNRLISLLYKNLYLLAQQKSFSVFLILLPLVTSIFFNLTIGHDPKGLKIAIVNKELQQKNLESCRPVNYNECFLYSSQNILLSCAYIEHLQSKSLKIVYFDELEMALSAVKKNYVWGLLYFPDNYTISMANRYMEVSKTPNVHVERSTVQVWIDLSNKYIGSFLKISAVDGLQEYLGEALSKCNISYKIGTTPISFKNPIYGSEEIAFIHYASAAILCLQSYFLPALFTLSLIMSEKQEGMMDRMLICGIKIREVLLSTFIIQLMIHIVQTAISAYVIYVYFDNPYLGDHMPVAIILVLIGMEGMIFGFLLGASCKSFMIAAFLGAGLNISFCLSCGLIWPLEGAHYSMKLIGPFFPLNAPVKALIMITNRGWSFGSEPVYLGIVSILCWSIIKITVIFIISRINKDLWISRK